MAGERRHADYRAWLLMQPCCCQPCVGSVVIHHHTSGQTEQHAKSAGGRRGKSQRASDADGMPLCHRHHSDLHDRLGLSGFFASFDKRSLRAWQDDQVERLQRLYAMAFPEPLVSAATEQAKREHPRAADAAGRERLRIAAWLRDKAGARHLKVNEAAVLTDAASELEQQTGGEF